ncbi:hypothetical protein CROQUDRAFT_41175 [Cronartium quercuum f. sp. fusiforme G11]|uniref:Uncharacterized protein n=1 Tax=Cronartium quercuum f. sp. fusiforme G11 TaxID=708437 RepID=A0A9P6NQS2_9BASI|nr:hypothetical protein CROQUDRAFT_41175 [Cronartium quercuum f. sp. fusiforme G11]
MDFTPLYPHSSSSSSTISPDGQYVLTSVGDRLVLRSTSSMQVVRSWRCQQPSESSRNENQPTKPALTSQVAKKPAHPSRTVSNPIGPNPRAGIPSFRATTVTAATEERRLSRLTCISFSPNSECVVALSRQATTSVIYVHSIHSNDLVACIEVGAEGVAAGEKAVRWGPGNDCLMVWSDWGLRITIWPLTSTQPQPVQLHHPKHGPHLGSTFSSDSHYFALICRQPGQTRDQVAIYDTLGWACVSLFELPADLVDVAHIRWSPCGRYLALVESALFNYRVEIRTPTGVKVGEYLPFKNLIDPPASTTHSSDHGRPDRHGSGRTQSTLNEKWSKSEKADVTDDRSIIDGYVGLGIRQVKWRPGGEYLAIGGWDGRMRILNDLTWTPICEIDLNARLSTQILSEPLGWIERTRAHGIIPFDSTSPATLTAPLVPDFTKPNPTMGVREMEWSSDGELIGCRNDAMPTTLYVFSFRSTNAGPVSISSGSVFATSTVPLKPRLASIVQFEQPIKSIAWHPTQSILAIVCANSALYLWYASRPEPSLESSTQSSRSAEWIEGIGIPAKVPFAPVLISWIQNGAALLITDKTAFCLGFIVPDELLGDRSEGSRIHEEGFSIPEY